jgi:hypothetical protein
MKNWKLLLLLGAGLLLAGWPLARPGRAAEPARAGPKAAGGLVVTDSAGKEHKLKTWKFVTGTQRLSWLAAGAGNKAEKDPQKAAGKAAGPEALVFRGEKSTDLLEGIVTFILLDRIRAIEYDAEKKTVTVRVAKPGDKGDAEEVLTGSTRFKGENKLTIEAESDLGELGLAAVKFQGGVPKGVKTIRFPTPRAPAAAAASRTARVTDVDKKVHPVADLQPLYRLAGDSQRLLPTLLFKKTVKIDLGKIKKLAFVDSGDKQGGGLDYEVTLHDDKSHTLTLLNRVSPLDGKAALLEGFVGRVDAGYQFFPLRASPNQVFSEIQFERAKKDGAKKDKEKQDQK